MAFNTYSPKDVLVVVGVVPITGYADGSFVEVDYNEEAYKLVIGADGEATRVKNANESGKITIKLTQSSMCNDLLSAIHIADRATGNGIVPILIKDKLGTSTMFAAECYIEKAPKLSYGKDMETREWVFVAAKITEHIGGNNVIGQLYDGIKK
ncbi:phage structural protein [Fluviispira vulneris]|uniref:phage structural protein n=1 Tax=Fluviispira vulneris TaxID=2763012 RepID=UPI001646C232|nr:phage protein [Fluviispira vulneris]